MVIITGASSGIGESTARAFAAEKRDLLLIARRAERLGKIKADLEAKFSIQVHTFALDVRSRPRLEEFASKERELLSRVTILVNNAGLAKGLDPFQNAKLDDWDVMIDTNLKGLLYLTRLVLPHFISKDEGHVVNLGSVAGHWVYPKGNVYNATKFAVHALTQAMRMDLSGTSIRVTEVSPGLVETEFSRVRLGDPTKAKAVYAGLQSLQPDDIAEIIVWCCNRPSRVNIQEVVVYPTAQAAPMVVHRTDGSQTVLK